MITQCTCYYQYTIYCSVGSVCPSVMCGLPGGLENWLIFSLLKADFARRVRLCCVFGGTANEALLVTDDDEVWALGSNVSGCLGIGDTRTALNPVKVEAICNKNVRSFAYGSGPHVLALTAQGDVYGWGHNGYAQIGNGQTSQVNSPVLISNNIPNPVAEVACGSFHSIARTISGEVYSWGQNNCGQLGVGATSSNQHNPRKVTGLIQSLFCVGIACGQTSTVAVFENGEIYAWGLNGSGQLGLGNNVNQMLPAKIDGLKNVTIQKVVCGFAHTMALSDEGTLYVWGANSYGQLGLGNKANQVNPVRMKTDQSRIIDVAASHYTQISAALTETSKVLMWGHCRGQAVTEPIVTPFKSLHDVFAAFSSVAITPLPMVVGHRWERCLTGILRQQFNDPTHSDIKFVVEGKTIHVHKTILKFRCEHFRTMFQDHWAENQKDTIKIEQFSHQVYKAFLEYLYTGEVALSPEGAIGLLDLANAYCEIGLKVHCQKIIKNGILVENCALLYAAAIKYEAKELEDFCFRFAMNHTTAVVQTEAFSKLDDGTLKDFIVRAAKYGAFRH
ncbi:RCC1 and BTB domain-containing protein 1-like [Varroa destructor]|uniref:BTB domain-containing protein n=1 Tax=Varroa destructor TaxID=109461 RepID=A0A7M7JWI5_VARDE|nr:RCC1 and BTB domain-containing protein 1-like [Varroa destructor]XP_022652163.1 RCC1 and BTB domain-containing protein 1-like [Varroa destructor]